MAFALARARRDAYLLARQEIREAVTRSVPALAITLDAADPLAAFRYPEGDDDLEALVHQHFEGCACSLRGR